MYQFWLFSFKTAKHWGHGPQDWTAAILRFDDYQQRSLISIPSPNTPTSGIGTPDATKPPMDDIASGAPDSGTETKPSQLCKWSIHVEVEYTESAPTPPPETQQLDLEDEGSWPKWPASEHPRTFTEKLNDGLGGNSFSNIKPNDLPIAVNQIAQAAKRSPEELDKEALGFGIMSRNGEFLSTLLVRWRKTIDPDGLYPFHLAVTYLDGSKTCCNILEELERKKPISLRKLYVNDLGHTVLDQLMMGILKAHTSCLPVVVDVAFKKERRFEGEDVDICGRWDADSDCIRTLLANGTSVVPFEWKHMFCHTSAQTICHCIGTIFGPHWGPEINTPSGLFVRRCPDCGLKLQNLPLHTLVLVGLHVVQSGCEDENLFGILACLICLLNNGANPRLKANISLRALLGQSDAGECDHVELDPLELAEKIPATLILAWSKALHIGWQVICKVLKHARMEWRLLPDGQYGSAFSTSSEDSECEMDTNEGPSRANHPCAALFDDSFFPDDHVSFFGESSVLPPLWAAIQAELLTYRRVNEGDPWISRNFDMDTLNQALDGGGDIGIALVQQKMMKPFCRCGRFLKALPACARVDDVAVHYFLNFEDMSRTTYIHSPETRYDSWS